MKESVSSSATVKILLLGDKNVGKTSLISTLISGEYNEKVPTKIEPIHIPKSENHGEVDLLIFDGSGYLNNAALSAANEELINNCDVVILVYDASVVESLNRLATFWLESVLKNCDKPIIIAGNKKDLKESESNFMVINEQELEEEEGMDGGNSASLRILRSLVEANDHIEAFLECSAKMNINVQDVFYLAQQAKLYPINPLISPLTLDLQPKAKQAFTRIFRVFDEDRDGKLNDGELNNYQEECFGARLPPPDLERFKQVLSNSNSNNNNNSNSASNVETSPATAAAVTSVVGLLDFLHLHKLYISKNRPETAWLVLRKFGYNEKLELDVENDAAVKEVAAALERDQTIELNKKGNAFLVGLFSQFDADNDGTLNQQEFEELFSVLPEGMVFWGNVPPPPVASALSFAKLTRSKPSLINFPDSCLTNANNNHLTLPGWLSQWSLTFCLQPLVGLKMLKILGFRGSLWNALKTTQPRNNKNNYSKTGRSVVRAFVFGSEGVGKSSLLKTLVKKKQPQITFPADSSCIASIKENYLVLTKVGGGETATLDVNFIDVDIAILMFALDSMESVEYLRKIQSAIPSYVPCVYLGNKTDLKKSDQVLKAAQALCEEYSLVHPECFSLNNVTSFNKNNAAFDKIFEVLLQTSFYPQAARPITKQQLEVIQKQKKLIKLVGIVLTVGFVSGVVAFAWWGVKKVNNNNNSSEKKR